MVKISGLDVQEWVVRSYSTCGGRKYTGWFVFWRSQRLVCGLHLGSVTYLDKTDICDISFRRKSDEYSSLPTAKRPGYRGGLRVVCAVSLNMVQAYRYLDLINTIPVTIVTRLTTPIEPISLTDRRHFFSQAESLGWSERYFTFYGLCGKPVSVRDTQGHGIVSYNEKTALSRPVAQISVSAASWINRGRFHYSFVAGDCRVNSWRHPNRRSDQNHPRNTDITSLTVPIRSVLTAFQRPFWKCTRQRLKPLRRASVLKHIVFVALVWASLKAIYRWLIIMPFHWNYPPTPAVFVLSVAVATYMSVELLYRHKGNSP